MCQKGGTRFFALEQPVPQWESAVVSLFPDAPDEKFKQFVYDRFSQVGKAFASPHRLVVLNILCQGEHTVESLARHAALTVANVSRHLQLLRGVNLVRQRKEGKFVYYSLIHFYAGRIKRNSRPKSRYIDQKQSQQDQARNPRRNSSSERKQNSKRKQQIKKLPRQRQAKVSRK